MTVALNRKRARIDSIRRRHLLDLVQIRHGALLLPNDAPSRDMLIALFAVGMNAAEALTIAPWAHDEIDELVGDAKQLGPWSSAALGSLVSLLDVEREMGDADGRRLTSLRPIDVPWHIIQLRKKKRRRIYEQKYKQRRRRMKKEIREMAIDLDEWAQTLIVALSAYDKKWVATSELLRNVESGRAWLGPDGKPLGKESLRKAARRTFDALEKMGLITSKYEVGRTGLRTRFVRSDRGVDAFLSQRDTGTWDSASTKTEQPQRFTLSTPRSENASTQRTSYLGAVDTRPVPPASALTSVAGACGPSARAAPVKRPGSRRRYKLMRMLRRAVEKVRGVRTEIDEQIIGQIADIQMVVLDQAKDLQDYGNVPLSPTQLEQYTRAQRIIDNKMRLLRLSPALFARAQPAPSLAGLHERLGARSP